MLEMKFRECGYVCLTDNELQQRGGISFNPLRIIQKVVDFLMEYREEIVRGYMRGWRGC
jgi:hypothetical protein